MVLVEILVPANGSSDQFRRLKDELTERFGGVTVFSRAPAEGLWKEEPSSPPTRDDIIVFEVMVEELERDWWREYRHELESRHGEDVIVIRATTVERL